MARKYTYHRENCNSCIRKTTIDILGRIIVLTGTHAFEWKVIIMDYCKITTIQFKNRELATKEFNKYRRKRC